MNILLISTLFPYSTQTKRIKTTYALYNFIKKWVKDNQVTVIRPYYRPNFKPFNSKVELKENKIKLNNFKIVDIPVYRIPIIEKYFINNVVNYIKNEKIEYDIILSHLRDSIMFSYKIAGNFNKPFVAGIHYGDILRLKNPWYRYRFKKPIKKAAIIGCRSEAIKKQFEKYFPEFIDKVRIINSGIKKGLIEDKQFFEKKAEQIMKREKLIIFTASNFIERKNIHLNLKALSMVDDNIDWEYEIAGDGPEMQYLKNLVKELKLTKKVNFLGYLNNNDVLEKMKESDIFLMVSVPETFGLVYLEAMSKGSIVIGAKNWGIDGVIRDEYNGFLSDPYPENIYNKLKKIMKLKKNKNLKEIIHNQYKTINNFTSEKMAEKYLEIIKNRV